jgi:hypothetical protein
MSGYVCVHVVCSCNALSGSACFDAPGRLCINCREALLRLAFVLRKRFDTALLQAAAILVQLLCCCLAVSP